MKFIKVTVAIMLLALLTNFASAQFSGLQSKLFEDADKLKQELEVIQAPLLSPDNYKNAIEAYDEAKARYARRKSLGSIEKLLREFKKYAMKAKDITRTAKAVFETTLNVRNEALEFKANEAAKELFNSAEEKLISAAKDYEDNDLEDAKDNARKAAEYYNKASLKAIKISLLDEARIYIQEAKNLDAHKSCSRTYVKARQLKQQVEEILNNNLKAGSKVKSLAEEATYEAKHAISLAKAVNKLKDKDANWELLILMMEGIIGDIASEFNYQADFSNSLEKDLKKSKNDIILSIKNNKDENLELKKEVKSLQLEIDELQEKLSALQSSQQKVQDELRAKKELEKKILAIEQQFNKTEAVVFRSKNNVILRLYGLTFPSGKSDILPQYFQLLTRVQNAIRKLSAQKVVIEGHTDGIGNDAYNLNLSQLRATSVQSYLVANMGVDEEFIRAVGYGKAKPIAPNDTKENRAKNRRIDVVLVLKNSME